jgi:hypothetical protein
LAKASRVIREEVVSESAVEEKTCSTCKGVGLVVVKHDGKSATPWWFSKDLPFLLHHNGRTVGVPAGHTVAECPDCKKRVQL